MRAITAALAARPFTAVTCEIVSAPGGELHATADSWSARPPVRVYVKDLASSRRTQIDFHEVWWADVNEPYSLMKQLRFWMWSLSVWLYPNKRRSLLPTAGAVTPPSSPHGRALEAWNRLRLLGIGFVAVLLAASVGLVTFLAERLLKLAPPDIVRTFVNYVAGVKLYNQKHRMGAGIPSSPVDFLDSMGEPPRVSIRRRMIRTLMIMGGERYDRWYVFAHSLGSVVAFNGLMETAYAWPGYFDYDTWHEAKTAPKPLAGLAQNGWPDPPPGDTLPTRPVWAAPREIAYRSRIFENFHGLLTFGSPLEKFAAIWPARVPISKEPAFRAGTEWINVYDPTDPVSGVLRAFSRAGTPCCPAPRNHGFAAGPILLLSHLKYLRASRTRSGLADGIAEWLLTGSTAKIGTGQGWFVPGSAEHFWRGVLAWVSWLLAVVILTLLGALVLPPVVSTLRKSACALERSIDSGIHRSAARCEVTHPVDEEERP